MRKPNLFRFLLMLSMSAGMCAQPLPAPPARVTNITLGHSIVPLTGPWKFHIGDSPRANGAAVPQWADPGFDDSHWETVDLTPKAGSFDPNVGTSAYVPGWAAKGHPGYSGWAWYRIRVQVVAAPDEKLALAGPSNVDDGFQVFDNGRLLGSFGKFSASHRRPVTYYTQPQMFLLPRLETDRHGGMATKVLAYRVWMNPSTMTLHPNAGGVHDAPLLGEAGVVAARYRLQWLELVRSYATSAVEALLSVLLAILASSLILFDSSDPVYRWLTAVFLLNAVIAANLCLAAWTRTEGELTLAMLANALFRPLILGGWVMVWWVWFRLRRPEWFPKVIAVLTLTLALSAALGEDLLSTIVPHSFGAALHTVSIAIRLTFPLLLLLIVFWGIQQRGREGWLALPAVILVGIAEFQHKLGLRHIRIIWFPFGVQISLHQIAIALLAAAIFGLLLRRLLLSLRRQRETALDIKQAQQVQHVLIPEYLPNIPGLTIESDYRPAREVGGDFFQIVLNETDGSALIVVGDVAGKGLQAGMLVALIVGAVRTAIQYDPDALHVLQALNYRLCGRGHAHATCLAMHVGTDGAVTLANAGHLRPYLNGKELAIEGALPLGILADAEFSVMHFHLAPRDTLMLMSDGVAEAQDEKGHLFGFDRIQAMLQRPVSAAEIATAAQTFGQADDISVLRITRMAEFVVEHFASPVKAAS